MMRVLSPLAVCVFILLAACDSDKVHLSNGDPAPGFHLEYLQRGDAHFPNDFADKVVVIRFWADWCPFCESEMQAIEPVYRRYRGQDLVILALNVRQDRETAAAFIDKLGISYDVLLDIEGEVARAYGVLGLPTTFIIDRKGRLHKKIIGESTPEVFEQILGELM
ncbi:MAG: TlpA family protein disulfide reductase [Candidatus Thiodiazotropha sp. (ex Monitilora ramsayi)]|nr:TlpA family protein disulfide reductase [Candidatus Thiodiazotropha sp. (ex Monitilora ramsayi)]